VLTSETIGLRSQRAVVLNGVSGVVIVAEGHGYLISDDAISTGKNAGIKGWIEFSGE
jgi:hypothetical protein